MNIPVRRSIFVLIVLLAVTADFAAAQSSAGRGVLPQTRLFVTSNVQGASVLLNNALVGTTPFSRNLNPGSYTVTVQATGYQTYSATVTVNGPVTVNAYLQPNNYSLTVNSNVNGAYVFINGQQMGQAPYTTTLAPGGYQLRVSAPGYQDFSAQVTVSQNTSITATLQPYNYNLTVNSNVNGAIIYINGQAQGQAPQTITLAPGNYSLRVTAPGYQDFSTQVTVNQNTSITASLQPLLATIRIRIPDQFLNFQGDRFKGDRGRAREGIRVFVDNQRVNQSDFQVPAGNHTVRFESGAFVVSQTFSFNAGQTYTVSPTLSISVQ